MFQIKFINSFKAKTLLSILVLSYAFTLNAETIPRDKYLENPYLEYVEQCYEAVAPIQNKEAVFFSCKITEEIDSLFTFGLGFSGTANTAPEIIVGHLASLNEAISCAYEGLTHVPKVLCTSKQPNPEYDELKKAIDNLTAFKNLLKDNLK